MRARHNDTPSVRSADVPPTLPDTTSDRAQVAREIAGLFLIVLGVLGALGALATVDIRLALGVGSLGVIAAGVALATTRTKE